MKRDELEQWAIRHNYTQDKFGHYQKANGSDTTRLKLNKIAVRLERKVKIVDHNEWLRIKSGYYKNLSLTEDDKLKGLTR